MGYTDRADDAPNVAQLGREVHNAFVGSNLNVGMHVHERGSGQFFCPLTLARRGRANPLLALYDRRVPIISDHEGVSTANKQSYLRLLLWASQCTCALRTPAPADAGHPVGAFNTPALLSLSCVRKKRARLPPNEWSQPPLMLWLSTEEAGSGGDAPSTSESSIVRWE